MNLNVSPYYDDFDDTKNFNRILFRPGFAVQARELTQLQTLLQNQIAKFGNHIFKDGAIVAGCEFKIDSARAFVKILDTDASSVAVENSSLVNYISDTVTGQTSGMTAVILGTEEGSEVEQPDLKTIYLRYTSGDGASEAVHFTGGETLTVSSEDLGRDGNTFVVDDTYDAEDPINSYWGLGTTVTVEDGIIFLGGKFVNHTTQTIVVSKYVTRPSAKVGVEINEVILSSNEDQTLLDPAQGSFNFAAPGADRYSVSTTLVSYLSEETPPPTFNQILEIANGSVLRKYDTNIYAELGKNLARRTYDESGNYATRQFPVLVKEHLNVDGNNGLRDLNISDPQRGGNPNLLAVGLEAGKAYVRGYEHETFQTEYVIIPKGLTTVTVQESPISTAYGNYILVDEFCGLWDLNGGDRVSLRDATAGAITATTFSATTAPGSAIGTARIKQIVYESGTAGTASARYRLYLYDIQMTSGSFDDVRGVYYNDAAADGHGDVVLTGGNAVIQENRFNKSLFRLPSRATKTIAPGAIYDNSFIYTKEFDGELNTNGAVTLTLSGNETFPYNSFTATIIRNNFTMILKDAETIDGVARPIGSVLDITGAGFTKNSAQSITIDLDGTVDTPPTQVKVYVNVQSANARPVLKVLRQNRFVIINTNTHPLSDDGTYSLGLSDVYSIRNIFIGEHTDSDADVVTAANDVTSSFVLDNGQRDTQYRNAKIIKRLSSLSLTDKKLVVKLDYFTHDGASANGTFFTVDSYPIDDTGATAGTIRTQNIPVYTSPVLGESFDLRDTLDFRVRLSDTAANATSVASATTNPTDSVTISAPSIGVTNPVPTEQFTTDLEYYLGRTDRLIIDSEGVFSSIYGSPSLNPTIPAEPENAMSLATINIPPYPSLAPNVAKSFGRPEYGVTFRTIDNRRYTMRDIGVLEQRINRLEYYTSLSLLEKAASDLSIPDVNGLDRFKNGILVDAFTGHSVGNVFDPAYRISIDPSKKEMRPFFNLENIDLGVDFENSTNIFKTGDLVTLPYTSVELTKNISASKPRNCVGELLFNFVGNMELDPPVDNWTDTAISPDVSINFDGNFDAWEVMANSWGTSWGDWQDTVTGRTEVGQTSQTVSGNTSQRGDTLFQEQTQIITTTVEQRQTRQGVSLSVIPETQTQRTGSRVTNTSLIPFMRSVAITFIARRLKPNTRVHPFFDGVRVSEHCRPLNFDPDINTRPIDPVAYSVFADGDYGDPLITNAQGVCVGQFRIPAGTFRTGDKNFRLCDDQFNRDTFITTSATQTWSANGLSQTVQDTIISTRMPNITTSTISDSRSVFETITTQNRLQDRNIGLIDNTVSNTFTTVNNIVNIENTVIDIEEVTETEVITVVQDPPTILPPPPPSPTPPPPPPPEPQTVPVLLTPVPDPCEEFFDCTGDFFMGPVAGGLNAFDFFSFANFTPFEPICIPVCGGNFNTNWIDPIAQTFFVEGVPFGCYATNLDVYFRTKSSTAPITLQIREVINGYPGNRILPFGEVTLQPEDIDVSEDATAATTFRFPSPVYLQNNTEYCFVLLPAGNNPDYNIWVSELGENEVGTETRIFEQPNIGMLFSSANNRSWTAYQAEDIKFTLRRANFTINQTSELVLKNFDSDYLRFGSFSDSVFQSGDRIHGFSFDITNAGTGYTDGVVPHTLSGGGATTNATVDVTITGGAVTEIVVTDPGSGYTGNPTLIISSGAGSDAEIAVTLNTGFIKQYDTLYNVAKVLNSVGSFSVGQLIGNGSTYAELFEIEDKQLNVLDTNIGFVDHTPTQAIWSIAPTATGASSAGTTFERIDFGHEHALSYEAQVYSYSNEQANLGGDKSLTVRVGLNTQTSTVSPVIDMRKCSIIAIANDVNNDTTGEEGNNGAAASKYISRRVVLDDGQDAEDLKVYLSNKIPAEGDVTVYGRFQNATDSSLFEDLPWVELEITKIPLDSSSRSGFVEYEYTIPSANKNNGNVYEYSVGSATFTGYKSFAVKIIPLSTNSSIVPLVREMRAIALQV